MKLYVTTFSNKGPLQLKDFEAATERVGQKLTVRRRDGFHHEYCYIAAFIANLSNYNYQPHHLGSRRCE